MGARSRGRAVAAHQVRAAHERAREDRGARLAGREGLIGGVVARLRRHRSPFSTTCLGTLEHDEIVLAHQLLLLDEAEARGLDLPDRGLLVRAGVIDALLVRLPRDLLEVDHHQASAWAKSMVRRPVPAPTSATAIPGVTPVAASISLRFR